MPAFLEDVKDNWKIHDWLIASGYSVSIEHGMDGKWVEVDFYHEANYKFWITLVGERSFPELLYRLAFYERVSVYYRDGKAYFDVNIR